MQDKMPETFFAPPECADADDIKRQFQTLINTPFFAQLFDSVPNGMLVLNPQRQIVFANRNALLLAGARDITDALGLRPGNALHCIYSDEPPHGCGTTEFCKTCGAVRAILSSQSGRGDVQECRITRKPDGDALDLRVWAYPFKTDDMPLTIFALMDISDEKRRQALERIFFHDVLNTAGGIKGFSELLKDAGPEEVKEYKEIIFSLSRMIVDEINSQRTLIAAENNELTVTPVSIRSLTILKESANLYKHHEIAAGREIRLNPESNDVEIKTDPALLQRVIGNMVKNALEACRPGETVTAGCVSADKHIEFSVHNPNEMPRDIQLQVFQRSFSTKGKGRGLGTYSMKLITERYLQGSVSFESGPDGTVFRARYPLEIQPVS